MAKGQKRSSREAKKPAASKKKIVGGSVPSVLAKPKPGAGTADSKK